MFLELEVDRLCHPPIAKAALGRVGIWRGGFRSNISVAASMRKEHQKPAKVRPSLADRFMLAVSFSRAVDGVWIGSYRAPEYLPLVERALFLIRQKSPLRYCLIRPSTLWPSVETLRGGKICLTRVFSSAKSA